MNEKKSLKEMFAGLKKEKQPVEEKEKKVFSPITQVMIYWMTGYAHIYHMIDDARIRKEHKQAEKAASTTAA